MPFHSLGLAFCHMVHLCCGGNALPTTAWQAMVLVYPYIVHIIPRFAEEGYIATLSEHERPQTWFGPTQWCTRMRHVAGMSGWLNDMPRDQY